MSTSTQPKDQTTSKVDSTISPEETRLFQEQEHIYENAHTYKNVRFVKNGASLIPSIVRNFSLRVGGGMNNIQCPPELLKRMSVLELYGLLVSPRSFLFQDWSALTPEDRFLCVLKWFLNQQMYYPQDGLQDVKPFNPILGEEFHCRWTHEDSVTTCIAEQVSHHPPISGVYLENRKYGFYFQQTVQPISLFYGTSVYTTLEGENLLKLVDLDEEYYYKDPKANMRGLLFGTSRLELTGDMTLFCTKNNLSARLTLSSNEVSGYVYRTSDDDKNSKGKPLYKVTGNMRKTVTIESLATGEKSTLTTDGCPRNPEFQMEVSPLTEQAPNESRRVWHDLTYGLMTNNDELAAEAKSRVENRERDLRKLRPSDWKWETDHKFKYFDRVDVILDTSTPKFVYKTPLTKE